MVECPKCGHRFSYSFKCNRCRHKWIQRGNGAPAVCPKCKSPYWNKPRVKRR